MDDEEHLPVVIEEDCKVSVQSEGRQSVRDAGKGILGLFLLQLIFCRVACSHREYTRLQEYIENLIQHILL